MGIFAYVVGEVATKKHKKLSRALELIADELETYAPRRTRLEIDGADHSGEYLLVAVMNLRSLGPALGLAPKAEFDDGELDVVMVHPEHREALVRHLRRASAEGDIALPHFELHRAKHVVLESHGKWSHVDDCPRQIDGAVIEVDVEPRAVKVLLPRVTA